MAASRVTDLHRPAFITGGSTGLGRACAEMLHHLIAVSGPPVVILDVRPGDSRTDFEGSVLCPTSVAGPSPRMPRAWKAFSAMMESGRWPAHAAAPLHRTLLCNRRGRFFKAVIAPFLARFGSLALQRRVQALSFNVT